MDPPVQNNQKTAVHLLWKSTKIINADTHEFFIKTISIFKPNKAGRQDNGLETAASVFWIIGNPPSITVAK
jgi:hypothetical protein